MTENAAKAPPKVSVCVVTYNHEKYIRRCLQSLVDQVTDFTFEILVGEDYSSDGTREIVREFTAEYPGLVKPILHDKNVGPCGNVALVRERAIGDYVAHMDGDDYALPGKLQKQADFLDRHPHCSFACHRALLVDENGISIGVAPEGPRPVFTDIDELVRGHIFFTHSSKMYRRSADIFDHSAQEEIIDFLTHVEHASTGPIGFLPELLCAYRKHARGVSSSTHERHHWLIGLTLRGFDRALQLGVDARVVNHGKAKFLVPRALACLRHADWAGFRVCILASRIDGRYLSLPHRVLYWMRVCPWFLRALLRAKGSLSSALKRLRPIPAHYGPVPAVESARSGKGR